MSYVCSSYYDHRLLKDRFEKLAFNNYAYISYDLCMLIKSELNQRSFLNFYLKNCFGNCLRIILSEIKSKEMDFFKFCREAS